MTRDFLLIHVATLLFGVAGLFGKLVYLSPVGIVFGRVFFAALFLGPALFLAGRKIRLQRRQDYVFLGLQGLILALHWGTFFKAIQVSSVAVGLLTFATFPVFTTLLEPLCERKAFQWTSLAPALWTLVGVFLVVPSFEVGSAMCEGALWGLASGLTFAVLSLFNRRFTRRYHGAVISFWQDTAAALFLLPVLLISPEIPTKADVGLLLLLGVLFTGISHTLFIQGMRTVSARRASIVVSLEPVYGIAAALLILGEVPAVRSLAGGAMILAAASWVTLRRA
ncbi:DMT family transporter [Desulfoluna sp.]|uniref:DMT family transporter n=1 Tax=Desulfoluna sp. TaxID=2045199 RepID=UPI0026266E0F|nr:DMT family transporter [Desulfoluna sp.]